MPVEWCEATRLSTRPLPASLVCETSPLRKKRAGGMTPRLEFSKMCRLELRDNTRVVETPAVVVDRRAATDTGEAVRRHLVRDVVRTDVQVEPLREVIGDAHVVVHDRRVLHDRSIIGVLRREAVDRIIVLERVEVLLADPAVLIAEQPAAGLQV